MDFIPISILSQYGLVPKFASSGIIHPTLFSLVRNIKLHSGVEGHILTILGVAAVVLFSK